MQWSLEFYVLGPVHVAKDERSQLINFRSIFSKHKFVVEWVKIKAMLVGVLLGYESEVWVGHFGCG